MSSNGWKEYKFSEILSTPLKNGVNKPTKVRGDGYKMVNMGELFANSIIRNMEMARVPMTDAELKNSLLQSEDLLFARQSLTVEGAGKCSLFIGDDEQYTFEGHLIRARVNREIAFPRYIYYYFNSFVGKSKIETLVHVTAAAGIRSSELSNLKIELPPLPTQRRIADILFALDEKIELNRQTNMTLEAMAQAIFKEWFVNFNFPNATGEMIESELGVIPKGWQVTSLGEIADLSWGDTNTTKRSYVDEGFPAYSASGQDGYLPYFDFDKTGIVVSAIGAYAGRTWLALGKWSCIKNTIRFWSTEENISNEFLYLYTRAESFWTLRGSAQPFISQTDSRNTKIIYPNNSLARQFGEIVRPLFERIEHNNNENNYLSQIRDFLLPKLLNGEIDV